MQMKARNMTSLILGGVLGATTLYLFDPVSGNRRRAFVGQKAKKLGSQTGTLFAKASRDMVHRGQGVISEAKAMFQSHECTDDVLQERVRAKMGRVISHPGAIHVEAQNGWVILRGDILTDEVDRLERAIAKVPGVHNVELCLNMYDEPGEVSTLQGGFAREERRELAQENWSPAIRVLAGFAGASAMSCGAMKRSATTLAGAALGTGVLVRAITNKPFKHLFKKTEKTETLAELRRESWEEGQKQRA